VAPKRHPGAAVADIDFKLLVDAETRSFKAGETIFRAGDPASELFVVQRGTVQIRVRERVAETVCEYGIFGEMALIDDAPRAATAVAVSDVRLVPVSQKQFLFMVSHTPHFALNVMRLLARRLRAANDAST
jgi:CRP/FNR family transcriptional regulator, cyclic AMP receptor protein